MPAPEAAVEHYNAQQRQAQAVALLARRQWRRMSADDLDRSWAAIVERLVVLLTAGQLGAAKAGAAYVASVLDDNQVVTVSAGAFSGVASDGRALDSLMFSTVIRTKRAIGRGLPAGDGLEVGEKWLDTLVRTQVADAGRGATGVAIAARPKVGYYRLVSPPCCQRCALLAGRFFKWNAGFLRHPKCDCRHVPANEDERKGWTSKSNADQVKDLTAAQRKAVGDGADLNKVINSHRANTRTKSGLYTSEGQTRRSGQRRLTPEGIYRLSGDNREKAIDLLRRYGYLL